MRITDLIIYLENVKIEHGDLLVCGEDTSCVGTSLYTKGPLVRELYRPVGRQKLYKTWVVGKYKGDFKVLLFGRCSEQNVEIGGLENNL